MTGNKTASEPVLDVGVQAGGGEIRTTMGEREMTRFAARLASRIGGRDAVIELEGDLGSGKTTLARALIRALGGPQRIPSPTYALLECYPLAAGQAVHLDLYRIQNAVEIEELGLDEILAAAPTILLVEWPERGTGMLPPADLHILLTGSGEVREIKITARNSNAGRWLPQ